MDAGSGIGQDIVNHCVNDILVQNARPLFFLDYIATSKLVPEVVAEVVTGVAAACKAVDCALLGGETAEMPGVYMPDAFDLAGTVVGIVDRAALLPRPDQMQAGDCLIGLPSSGPHTNGYSLIRQIVAGRDLNQPIGDGTQTLADALLNPHRCYRAELDAIQAAQIPLLGLAHITGGGLIDNLPRVLPAHLAAQIDLAAWELPSLFAHLLAWGEIDRSAAHRIFNMGIGMVVIAPFEQAEAICAVVPEAIPMGRLVERGDGAAVTLIH